MRPRFQKGDIINKDVDHYNAYEFVEYTKAEAYLKPSRSVPAIRVIGLLRNGNRTAAHTIKSSRFPYVHTVHRDGVQIWPQTGGAQ